jgi:hypothetical protein
LQRRRHAALTRVGRLRRLRQPPRGAALPL